jgi:flavin-dependent dehydrogenase
MMTNATYNEPDIDTPAGEYDVVILGGGLAGLTLSLQLKRTLPSCTVVVVERRPRAAREAAFKVGESTVELSAHYFAEVLGLEDHLTESQLLKGGLRYFFPAGDNSDITARVEWGGTSLPPVRSYQLDRGRFENELAERSRRHGAHVLAGWQVQEVELGGERHKVIIKRNGADHLLSARWVVDATGFSGFLKRKLELEKPVEHDINASWFRLAGGLDIEELSDEQSWRERMDTRDVRKLCTNHLMGEGYWVWLIPLASGPVSIGIVADPRFHPFDQIDTLEGAMEWLTRHEPQLAKALEGREDQVVDFLRVENFARGVKRVFSRDRWALTGVSGVFSDPFYSPGSDFIAEGNTAITELITRDAAGENIDRLVIAFNAAYLTRFDSLLRGVYTNHYQLFGNAEVMSAKLLWESAVYWSYAALPFYNEKLTDFKFGAAVRPLVRRVAAVSERMETLFRDWHELGSREWRDTLITNHGFPALAQMQRDLAGGYSDRDLIRKYEENLETLEAIAVVIFHTALELLPEHSIDPDRIINPAAISLNRDRWAEEGLFSGTGVTLAQARERAAGIETMLLDRVAQLA